MSYRLSEGASSPDSSDSPGSLSYSPKQLYTVTHWRRAEVKDIDNIRKLFKTPYTKEMFGDVDITLLVERSYMPMSVFNENEDIVACLILERFPNIPIVPPSKWLECIKAHYGLEFLTARNTLFVHLLVWDHYYDKDSFKFFLENAFLANPYLEHIIMVVPPNATTSDIFDEHFVRNYPISCEGDKQKAQWLFLCMRQRHVPKLNIRLAMEDDNDDLMDIFTDVEFIYDTYGEYYFAELCNQEDDKSSMIVAEDSEHLAVGVMRLSSDIDTDCLTKNFHLEAFHGFHKPSYLDHEVEPEDKAMVRRSPVKEADIQIGSQLEMSQSEEKEVEILFEDTRRCTIELCRGSYSMRSSYSDSIEWVPPKPSPTDLGDPDPQLATVSLDEIHHLVTDLQYNLKDQKHFEELNWLGYHSATEMLGKRYTVIKQEVVNIPVYAGKQNAFAIVLYGMSENYDERRAHDFLASAFACFPEMDYCIITMPPNKRVFPLLQYFMRAVPRSGRSFRRELYFIHKSAVLSEPEVREASTSELREARSLAAAVGRTDILRNFDKDSHLRGYVLLLGGVIVGVAVLRCLTDVSDLSERYDLRPVCGSGVEHGRHALLRLLAVNPPFACFERFFLDELLRLSNTICLHYLLLSDRKCGVTALRELTPVMPRRMIQYWLPSLPCGRPRAHLLRKAPPAALLVASSSLAAPRIDINCRIIVVGASQAGLGFIERLVYRSALMGVRLCNVTLVSRDGLPGGGVGGVVQRLLPRRGRSTPRRTMQLGLHVWINVVCGLMTDIKREKKCIVINGQCIVRYDYLYLFCGRQFQKPEVHDRLKYVYNADECHSLILYKKSPQGPAEYPDNVFVVNTEKEAAHSLKTLHRLIGDQKKYTIIVFGHSINAFCCMTALLEYGIPGPCITFVESFPDHMTGSTNTIFNNPEIDSAMLANLHAEGIHIHSGFYFHSWVLSETEPRVLNASFISMTKTIGLDCVAFFYYSPKTISRTTYKALRRASLPFDGGVLVDDHFRTPDPYILAAGPVTRYSPQLCTLPMHRYDSEEIGERVADELLVRLQEEYGVCGSTEEPEKRLGHEWHRPIVAFCKLPGGAYYLRVRKPGIDVPLEAQKAHSPEEDTILITGSCTKPQGYFRIHFDGCDIVRKITCYSQNKIDADNIICLYGKHESLLNNLMFRYEQGEISDFYEYFREPWCYAIYHDRFSELQDENLKVISSGKGLPGETVIDEIGAYLKETSWKKMPDGKRAELVSRFWASPIRRAVEERMLAFLRQNRDALPMYADPATFRPE